MITEALRRRLTGRSASLSTASPKGRKWLWSIGLVALAITSTGTGLPAPSAAAPVAAGRAELVRTTPNRFKKLTTANGLPQSSVYSMLQARDGYLWLTTLGGLARYDGLRMTVFTPTTTPGLSVSRLTCIFEDRAGTLWIGSEEGRLVRYADGVFTTFPAVEGADSAVTAIGESDDGVFVLTRVGCGRVEGDRFVSYDGGPQLSAACLFTFYGTGFVAHGADGRQMMSLANDRPRVVDVAGAAALSGFMQVDPEGVVWGRTTGGDLVRVHDGRAEVDPLGKVIPSPCLPKLRDRKGNVWFAAPSSPGLVGRVDPSGAVITYSSEDGFDDTIGVVSMMEDREGTVWLGTQSGLFRYQDERATGLKVRDGSSEVMVRAVFDDGRGDVWLDTFEGLALLSGGRLTRLSERDSNGSYMLRRDLSEDATGSTEPLYTGRVLTFLEAREGSVWVGCEAGVLVLENGRIRRETFGLPAGTRNVSALLKDRSGKIWVGTDRGLARIEDGEVTWFGSAAHGSRVSVMCLLERRDGSILCGTRNGLYRVGDGMLVPALADGKMPPRGLIRALYEDERGVLWAGTYDSGLCRIEGDRVDVVTAENGLFSNGVFSILPDRFGFLWMSSNQGIFKASRFNLDDFASGGASRVFSVSFLKEDGLPNTECNGGFQHAGYRRRDGTFCFNTMDGLALVDPEAVSPSSSPLPVFVTGVRRDDEVVPQADLLEILPGNTSFEIDYTAVSAVRPELVSFRYRLDGLDDVWTEAGTRRTAYFSRVPPGDYTFEVVAADAYGRWSEHGARMGVRIRPPFWRTWWFYALAVGCVIAIGYGVYHARIAQLRRRHEQEEARLRRTAEELELRVRERTSALETEVGERRRAEAEARAASQAKSLFLANMSHELRTPLNAVIGFAQLLTRSPRLGKGERNKLEIIRHSGEHLLELINDVLSISKIETGHVTIVDEPFDLSRMLRSVREIVGLRASAKGLEVAFDLAPGLPVAVRGDEGKLRQVLINLLGNAVKFTKRGRVTLRARWAENSGDGRAEFEIEDTGVGIAADEISKLFDVFVQTESGRRVREGTGLGLAISRSIVQMMGGEIRVESQVGKGTTFAFDVRLPATDEPVTQRSRRRIVGLDAGERRRRVLVVDDNRESRMLLTELLLSVGFDVREAANGEEAVQVWREWRPRLIWMDMLMPIVSGEDATRRIRWLEAGVSDDTPTVIIALTASVFEHERGSVLALGCDDLVTKPFHEETIFEKLESHLEVRFVYEDPAPPPESDRHVLTPERFAALPPDVFEALYKALAIGDMQAASSALDAVRRADEQLARAVGSAVAAFDVETALQAMDAVRGVRR